MSQENECEVSEYDEHLQPALKALSSVDNPKSVGKAAEAYEVNQGTLC